MKCECPDLVTGVCKWNKKDITYYEEMNFTGFTREEVKTIYDEAIMAWAKVADFNPIRVDDPSKANIVCRAAFLAVALGWSGLPCGVSNDAQLSQKIKSNMRWNRDSLWEVCTHELGHALGIPHIRGALMSPSAMGFKELTEKDIKAIQERYGKREEPLPDNKLRKEDFRIF